MLADEPTGPAAVAGEGPTLEERVARLERKVAELSTRSDLPARPEVPSHQTRKPGERPGRSRPAAPAWLKLGEDWVGRVGVLLILLGLALLYRYAVDRGWITPWLRVAFGLQLGGLLLGLGIYWRRVRPTYSQVLLGGGLAVLYLTGWAARVLFELVPWAPGFAFMVAITALALLLADRRRHQLLAVIGGAGGLATPFLLEPGNASISGLVLYAALILGWTGWLQLRRGWGVLLAVNLAGGIVVMGFAAGSAAGLDAWVTQAGVALVWAVACALPFLQAQRHARRPDAWPAPPELPILAGYLSQPPEAAAVRAITLGFLGVLASTLTVLVMVSLWSMQNVGAGLSFMGAAALMFVGAAALRNVMDIARPAAVAGAVLLVMGTALATPAAWRPLPLALEGAAFLWAWRVYHVRAIGNLAHVVFALLALGFLRRIQGATFFGDPPGPTVYQGTILLAMAIAAFAAFRTLKEQPAIRFYLAGSYVAFLAWIPWAARAWPEGQGITSVAWGASALLVLGLGLKTGSVPARLTGLATLGLLSLKLLVVDLATLDAGVRIILFLAFGAIFLGLGYVLRGSDALEAPAVESSDGKAGGGEPPLGARESPPL